MYTQRKIHSGFVGTLLLATAVVIFFLYARPLQVKQQELASSISALEKEVGNGQSAAAALPPAGSVSEVEQKDLNQAIPGKLEQDVIIANINTMAKTADVNLNGLQFSLQKSGNIPAIAISGSFQGAAANINRFLKLVEGNPRKLVIKDASVALSESVGGLELINLTVTLQAFYRHDE